MIRILFQGDSVTDGGRDRKDPTHLGVRHARLAAGYLRELHPDLELEILNRGIAGNETKDLIERLEQDVVLVDPDIVCLMIGINDTEHYAKDENWLDNSTFARQYRTILQTVKEQTKAKLVVMEPFYMPLKENVKFREDLTEKVDIAQKIASEYADVYVPTEKLLRQAWEGQELAQFIPDGLHPTEKGAEYLGKICAQYIDPLIEG